MKTGLIKTSNTCILVGRAMSIRPPPPEENNARVDKE